MAIYESKYTRTQLDEGIGASYVPTLNSAPTTSTLTYTRSDLPSGSQTVSFVVGQMCRVAVTGGYDFYQLTNISSNTATWTKVEYGGTLPNNVAYFSADDGSGIVPEDGIKVNTITAASAMTIVADKVNVISGNVGTATITLSVPSDNLAHVWEVIMTTDSSVSVTFSVASGTIYYPDGYELEASSVYDISIIGVNGLYFLRYGKFVTT